MLPRDDDDDPHGVAVPKGDAGGGAGMSRISIPGGIVRLRFVCVGDCVSRGCGSDSYAGGSAG
jgi:hypothetical protein